MSEVIAWNVARAAARRAASLVGSAEPFSASYLGEDFAKQMQEFTTQAAPLVGEVTGLRVSSPTTGLAVDRAGWANVNIESARRLLRPALDAVASKSSGGVTSVIGRNVTGAELGAVLGWMSARVMGQYDPRLFPNDPAPQDLIYYVTPNIVSIEKRFAFPPDEFRFWIALHEVTHRAQFVGCPWLGKYFLDQVTDLTSDTSFDVDQVVRELRRSIDSRRARSRESGNEENDTEDMGVFAALGGPERKEALGRMLGLMSLLEGHAEVVMGRAGPGRVPNAERFGRVFAERRKSARGFARFMQKVLGMDVKMRQYEQGAAFVRAVEDHGGEELFARVWEKQENCPTYQEIAKPALWIERIE